MEEMIQTLVNLLLEQLEDIKYTFKSIVKVK